MGTSHLMRREIYTRFTPYGPSRNEITLLILWRRKQFIFSRFKICIRSNQTLSSLTYGNSWRTSVENYLFQNGVHISLYRVSQEQRSIFWEVTVSVILSRKVCMYMYPIPNGFRDRALHCTLYRRATRHVLTRVAKCIDVDGENFENVL
jgi:hypothetical protein